MKNRKSATILTPHPGEMGRLLGINSKEVKEDREMAILRAVQAYHCVVLLKGSQTLIAAPEETPYLNDTGNPGMATGGSGDVLSGVIATDLISLLPRAIARCQRQTSHELKA